MNGDWQEIARLVLVRFELAILVYFVAVNSFYGALLIAALLEMRRHVRRLWEEDRDRLLASESIPVVSILAPAYNEAATIAESVRGLLTLHYPNLEVIVINDGSRDETLGRLKREFDLTALHPACEYAVPSKPIQGLYCSQTHPNLIVVDKENGGKADSLNAGLNLSNGELVCAIDADTLIEPDALLRMVRPFLRQDGLLAVGGTIQVVNGSPVREGRVVEVHSPSRPLPGIQTVEYLRAFLFGRLGWNRFGGNMIISGAFGLFRRDAMIGAGGYLQQTVGEDMEIVVRLRRHGYEQRRKGRVEFVPDPVAWTEVPESLRVLGRQRDRWHRGLAEVLWTHRRLFLNPRYGAMGMAAYPYFLLVEFCSPAIEAAGVLGTIAGLLLGAINYPFAILFFLLAYGYGLVLTIATLLLDEVSYHRFGALKERARLLGWAMLETFGYRQLTVFWRLRGIVRFLQGRHEWGSMERRGFNVAAGSSGSAQKAPK